MQCNKIILSGLISGAAFFGGAAESPPEKDVLSAMRDALHPRMSEKIAALDSETSTTNRDFILNWIIHVSLPSVTNETLYFDSYRKPISLPDSGVSIALLTNRAARLSYVPPIVHLSLLYDDGTRSSLARPVPGVDYPGVAYEDEGSTSGRMCLTLRAPKSHRRFKIVAKVISPVARELEFKWHRLEGRGNFSGISAHPTDLQASVAFLNVLTHWFDKTSGRMAVFVREKGMPWGPPAIVQIDADPLCTHCYDRKGNIEYIDYGSFRDIYKLDGQNRILGFTRIPQGMARGDEYSNFGEKIISTYSDDKPKTTHKVRYAVTNGKLTYTIAEDDIHYKNGPFKYRPTNY